MRSHRRGDTIIEVMLAFTVFALLSISVTVLMNRSMASGQRSLELTLVRQQIDAQADLLRYARDNNLPQWDTIKQRSNTSTNTGAQPSGTCFGSASDLPANAFYLRPRTGANPVEYVSANSTARFSPAATYSQVDYSLNRSSGLWITPVQVQNTGGEAFDMYIRACWHGVGQSQPMTISTIVRLYAT